MGGLSIWHILLFGVILLLLFGGGGKISDLMGDVAKGIKSFRQGLSDPDDAKTISGQANPPQPAPDKDKTSVS